MKRILLLAVAFLFAFVLADEGARYLIITTDNLESAVQPLAEWKQASGMQCKVAKLSEVGSDTTAIKAYIQNAYDNWPVRPEFVLLVGSPYALPARYYPGQRGWSYSSDNIYGDVTGDLRADIPVGRFPARTTSQCEVMVAKTLAYERYPEVADSFWMRRLTTVVREGGDRDDSIYWQNARYAAKLAEAAGFTSCDSLSYYRHHTASDVIASVNRGTGLVLYRGSAGGNWPQPFNVNPNQTSSGGKNRLPIIISTTCATMTLAPGESMVGDAWMKAGTSEDLRGAVAFFGNTHSASNVAKVRSAVARGFFTGLFKEGRYKLGHAALRAKEQLYFEFPTQTGDYLGFNLLGDPDLTIWTAAPRHPVVERPAGLGVGPQQLVAVVALDGCPVESALVCASMGASVYARGMTDAGGRVALDINPKQIGSVRLVVSAPNCYPYDAQIPVAVTAVEEKPLAVGAAVLTAAPAVFTRTTCIRWTGTGPTTLAVCDAAGRTVRKLETRDSQLGTSEATWDGQDDSGRQVRAGVYLAVLADSQGRQLARAKLLKLD